MKRPVLFVILMLMGLALVPNVAFADFVCGSAYQYQVNVSYASQPINMTVWVNLSAAGVTVQNGKGMEIKAMDWSGNLLPYQTVKEGQWYFKGVAHNISNTLRKDNFTFVQINNSASRTGFYLCYSNTTQQIDTSESIVVRDDDFQEYAVGDFYPSWVTEIGAGGTICQTTGGRVGLCSVSGNGQHFKINVDVSNQNSTVNIEMNATDSGLNNGVYIGTFGNANGYKSPQENGADSYQLLTGGGGSCGANASITTNFNDAAMNFTIDRAGNKVNLYMRTSNTALEHISCDDTSSLTHTATELSGSGAGSNNYMVMRITYYNRTVLVRNQPSLTFGSPESNTNAPIVNVSSPLNTTYVGYFVQHNFFVNDSESTTLTCWRTVDGVETNLGSIANSSTVSARINFTTSNVQHTIATTCQDAIQNTTLTRIFTLTDLPPTITVASPLNQSYTGYFVQHAFNVTDDITTTLTCWRTVDGAETNLGSVSNGSTVSARINFSTSNAQHNITTRCQDSFPQNSTVARIFTLIDTAPSITLTAPTNTTYYSTNVSTSFTCTDDVNATLKAWKIVDGVETALGNINNNSAVVSSEFFRGGQHNFTVRCQDYLTNTTSSVMLHVFQGVNVSAVLPNGTAIASWYLDSNNATSNITIAGISNPRLIEWSSLTQGNSSLNASKSGYDNQSWNIFVNDTMGLQNFTFILYPFSYVYFYDTGNAAYINSWSVAFVNSSGTYINSSVANFYTTSNRLLFAGSNTVIGTKSGYNERSVSITISNSTSFNLTINTTLTSFILAAYDEISQKELPFQSTFYLKGTNVTSLSMTGERRGQTCLYDSDESTSCFAITQTCGSSAVTQNTTTVQAFDFSQANFRMVWSNEFTSGGSADVTVYQSNGTQIYHGTSSSAETITTTVTSDNRGHDLPRAENLTIVVTGGCSGAGGNTQTTRIREFRMANNTIGYTYAGTTNHSITLPPTLLTNYTTYDLWVRGEENYLSGYANQRMYRVTFSTLSDFALSVFLLNDSAGYVQYFNVLDANNNPIENALITIRRWYSGTARTIVQCASNPAGSCATFLAPYTELQMLVQRDGYTTKTSNAVVFTGSPNPANVYLSSAGTGNFTSVFKGIEISLTPTDQYQNSAVNTSCSIAASEGNINFMNLTITRNVNQTEVFYNSSYTNSVSTGATLTRPINANGRFTVTCTYQWVSNSTGTPTTYENTNTLVLWIYSDTLRGAAKTQYDPAVALVLALGVIMIIAGTVALNSGGGYGVAVGIILMLMFAWTGFIDWYVAGLSILIAIAIVVLKSWV